MCVYMSINDKTEGGKEGEGGRQRGRKRGKIYEHLLSSRVLVFAEHCSMQSLIKSTCQWMEELVCMNVRNGERECVFVCVCFLTCSCVNIYICASVRAHI